jgi:Fic family protein
MLRKTLNDIDKLRSRWDGEQPLELTTQDNLWKSWKIIHTFHSLSLEGFDLTLEEVTKSVKNALLLKTKPKLERHFILNHAEAIDGISLFSEKRQVFTLANAFYFQNTLFKDLRPDEKLMKLRESDVLGEERLATTKAMLKLVTDLEYKEAHPVVKAARTHLGLTMIHPFDDMNGCIARLCMNLMLARDGYPLALILVETKTAYLDALELASKNCPSAFDEFVADRMKESLEANLNFIKN